MLQKRFFLVLQPELPTLFILTLVSVHYSLWSIKFWSNQQTKNTEDDISDISMFIWFSGSKILWMSWPFGMSLFTIGTLSTRQRVQEMIAADLTWRFILMRGTARCSATPSRRGSVYLEPNSGFYQKSIRGQVNWFSVQLAPNCTHFL